MYHSVSFWPKSADTTEGGRNSWASWRLIPSSRPYIAPPSQKSYTQDVPYANGVIDLSELGLDDVVFENRTGSIEFTIMNNMLSGYDTGKIRHNDGNKMTRFSMTNGTAKMWDWDKTYSTIMDYMHGKTMKVVLEDDVSFYYIGRVNVSGLNSEEHYTTISIDYNVDPYKKQRFSTTEDWLWDAIDFEANPDILGLKNINLAPGESITVNVPTLRKRIIPSIHLTGLSGEYNPLYVRITDSDDPASSPQQGRVIEFKNGTDNITSTSNIDNLYFHEKETVVLYIYNSIANNQTAKVSVNYRLEGL